MASRLAACCVHRLQQAAALEAQIAERDSELAATRDLCRRLDGVRVVVVAAACSWLCLTASIDASQVVGKMAKKLVGIRVRVPACERLWPPPARATWLSADRASVLLRFPLLCYQAAVHQHWDASGTSAAKQLKFLQHVQECEGVTRPVLDKCVPRQPCAGWALPPPPPRGGSMLDKCASFVVCLCRRLTHVTVTIMALAGIAERRRNWSAKCPCTG